MGRVSGGDVALFEASFHGFLQDLTIGKLDHHGADGILVWELNPDPNLLSTSAATPSSSAANSVLWRSSLRDDSE